MPSRLVFVHLFSIPLSSRICIVSCYVFNSILLCFCRVSVKLPSLRSRTHCTWVGDKVWCDVCVCVCVFVRACLCDACNYSFRPNTLDRKRRSLYQFPFYHSIAMSESSRFMSLMNLQACGDIRFFEGCPEVHLPGANFIS